MKTVNRVGSGCSLFFAIPSCCSRSQPSGLRRLNQKPRPENQQKPNQRKPRPRSKAPAKEASSCTGSDRRNRCPLEFRNLHAGLDEETGGGGGIPSRELIKVSQTGESFSAEYVGYLPQRFIEVKKTTSTETPFVGTLTYYERTLRCTGKTKETAPKALLNRWNNSGQRNLPLHQREVGLLTEWSLFFSALFLALPPPHDGSFHP